MFGDVITMGDAVVVCLFSLAVVFLVLLAISYMIDLVHYLLACGEKKPAAPAPAAPAAAAKAPARDDHADAVLVAAAVAAYLGTTTDQFVVRSIRRLVPEESPWVQASRMNRRDAR